MLVLAPPINMGIRHELLRRIIIAIAIGVVRRPVVERLLRRRTIGIALCGGRRASIVHIQVLLHSSPALVRESPELTVCQIWRSGASCASGKRFRLRRIRARIAHNGLPVDTVGDMREQSGSKVRHGVGYGLELLEDWVRCEGVLGRMGRFLTGRGQSQVGQIEMLTDACSYRR